MFGSMVNEEDKIIVPNQGEGDNDSTNKQLVTHDLKEVLDTNSNPQNIVVDEINTQTSSEDNVEQLKSQFHNSNTISEEHKKLMQHLAAKLGLSEIHSLEELVQSPKFIDIAHELLDTEGSAEIEKGNKRWIDKVLYDKLNKLFDTKTALYSYFMNDESTHPKILPNNTLANIDEHHFDFDDHKDTDKLFALRKQFPDISIDHLLPLNIQYVVLLAAQRYPELKDTKIHVQCVDGFKIMSSKQHVMRSQVNPLSLIKEITGLASPKDREYIIQVNVLDKDGVVVLPKVTQHSKGGVMVHEFAHSLDYSMKSAGKMAKFLAAFGISPRWVRGMERKTDETAITRGAGYGLYTFRKEVHGGSANDYVDYKKRTYLGPKEILYGILKHHTSYSQDILNKVIQHIINEEY